MQYNATAPAWHGAPCQVFATVNTTASICGTFLLTQPSAASSSQSPADTMQQGCSVPTRTAEPALFPGKQNCGLACSQQSRSRLVDNVVTQGAVWTRTPTTLTPTPAWRTTAAVSSGPQQPPLMPSAQPTYHSMAVMGQLSNPFKSNFKLSTPCSCSITA